MGLLRRRRLGRLGGGHLFDVAVVVADGGCFGAKGDFGHHVLATAAQLDAGKFHAVGSGLALFEADAFVCFSIDDDDRGISGVAKVGAYGEIHSEGDLLHDRCHCFQCERIFVPASLVALHVVRDGRLEGRCLLLCVCPNRRQQQKDDKASVFHEPAAPGDGSCATAGA